MSLTKLTQQGKTLYVNSEHVAIISPDSLIGKTNVTLINGLNINVDGTAEETANSFGYRSGWIQ